VDSKSNQKELKLLVECFSKNMIFLKEEFFNLSNAIKFLVIFATES